MSILETWSSGELVDLQRTNIKIAIRTNNIIYNQLTHKNNHKTDKYKQSGVYKLTCPDCSKACGSNRKKLLSPVQ